MNDFNDFFDKMKEHAGRAKDEAAKITKQMVDKTNNVITQTKLNFAVNETENKIKEIYTQMGEKLYAKYAGGEGIADEFEESCLKIDDLKAEAADLRAKLEEVKNAVKCSKCGEFNQKTSSYCSKCGASLKDAEEHAETESDTEYVEVEPVRPQETEGEE